MNCRKVSRRLSAYIEDDLPSSEKGKIDEHLKSCGACRRKAADMRKIIETAGQLDAHEPGPYFVNRVMCAVGQKQSPRELLSRWKYRLSLSSVAFVVAASATFFIMGPPATVMVDNDQGATGIESAGALPSDSPMMDEGMTTESGFPVPLEALERDMALEEQPVNDSLSSEPDVTVKHYVHPVSIKSDSNKAF